MENKRIEILKQLKSRESTIYKWLHEFCEEEKGNDEKVAKYEQGIKFLKECDEALDYAIENIKINETLRTENRNIKTKLETALEYIDMLQKRNKWVDVKSRLPDEFKEYYVTLDNLTEELVEYTQADEDNGEWTIGRWEKINGKYSFKIYDVIAWREKPEPYKRSTDEQD